MKKWLLHFRVRRLAKEALKKETREKILIKYPEGCDVTYDELISLRNVKGMEKFLKTLKNRWVGAFPDRANSVRAGTIYPAQIDGMKSLIFISRLRERE